MSEARASDEMDPGPSRYRVTVSVGLDFEAVGWSQAEIRANDLADLFSDWVTESFDTRVVCVELGEVSAR